MTNTQNINQLPKDWKIVSLEDIGYGKNAIVDGPFGSNLKTSDYISDSIGGVPVLTTKNLEGDYSDNKVRFISKQKFEELKRSQVNPGDILVAKIGSIGKVGIYPKNARTAIIPANLLKFTVSEDVVFKYVFYYLNSTQLQNKIKKISTATAQPAFNVTKFRRLPIPLPPRLAQQAIVSKIEELFSELDKAVEQLKTAQKQLKSYRQAVLKWAFEGKLTNENVKDGELPQGWKWTKLGDVIEKPKYGTSKKCEYEAKGTGVLRIPNVVKGVIDSSDLKFAQFDKQEIETYRLKEGDILTIRSNGSVDIVGKCALITKKDESFLYAGYLIRLRPIQTSILPKYLLYILSSIGLRHQIEAKAKSTSGVNNINSEELAILKISLPLIEEQRNIIQEIESRLSVVDKMDQSISESLQQADALKQSILERAFEGRLIATDTIETIKQAAKAIPSERKILAGKIIYLLHKDKYFGLTKFQKILYLIENFVEVTYETNFIQERAGPYDKEFTTAFRKEIQEKDWLREEQKGNITKFVPGHNLESLIKDYAICFRKKSEQIDFVIQQLKDKSTHDAELIATLYAVWNNRLIKKKPVKIELLAEDFFNWSAKKKEEFQKEEVVTTYNWMKKIKLVPSGFGKVIALEA